MASNRGRGRLLAIFTINIVMVRVLGIFRALTSFAYPEKPVSIVCD